MPPKRNKQKFVKLNDENLQLIQSKAKETPKNTGKTKRSPKVQGNPRENNTLNNEQIVDKEPALRTAECIPKQDIAQQEQSTQENPSSCLEISGGNNLDSQIYGKLLTKYFIILDAEIQRQFELQLC